MKATVTILETNFEVEYDFKITASGSPETGPSYSSGGEPAEPAEFEIEILGIARCSTPEAPLELPEWLKTEISESLYNRDDINEIIQRADHERGMYDPDDERL